MLRLVLSLLIITSLWAAQIVGKFTNNNCVTLRIAHSKKLLILGESEENGFRGLKIYDISFPMKPKLLSQYKTELYPTDIALFGYDHYVLLISSGYYNNFTRFRSQLEIFDIRDPYYPKKISSQNLDLPAQFCDITDNTAIIAANTYNLETDIIQSKVYFVDLSQPSIPTMIATKEVHGVVWGVDANVWEENGDDKKEAQVGAYIALEREGLGFLYLKDFDTIQYHYKTFPLIYSFLNVKIIKTFEEDEFMFFTGKFLQQQGVLGFTEGYGGFFLLTEPFVAPLIDILYDHKKTLFVFDWSHTIYILNLEKLFSYALDSNHLKQISRDVKLIVNISPKELIKQTLHLPNTQTIWYADITSDSHYFYVATNNGVFVVDIQTSNDNLVNYLLSKSFTKAGTFTRYDFPGVDSAFDWIFVTPSNKVYQLQGNPPTNDNVFGWKRVNVTPTITPNSWNMIYIGDYDRDGNTKFDWVLYKNTDNTTSIYKLDGVAPNGTFLYKKIEGLRAHIEGANNEMVFFTTNEAL